MKKLLLASAVLIGAVSASQAGVHVSIGLGLPLPPLPLPGVVFSAPAPVFVTPPASSVCVTPPACFVAPPVVTHGYGYAPRYYVHRDWDYRHDHRGWDHDRRWHHR